MKTVTVGPGVSLASRADYLSLNPGSVANAVGLMTTRLGLFAHVALAEMLLGPVPSACQKAFSVARRIADNRAWGHRNSEDVATVALRLNGAFCDFYPDFPEGPSGLARSCLLLALDVNWPPPDVNFRRAANDDRIPYCLWVPVSDTIRSIFPGPDPVSFSFARPACELAGLAYHTLDRSAFTPLSDILDEDGAPPEVLLNLRNPHSAVRGNWVLDAILGKR